MKNYIGIIIFVLFSLEQAYAQQESLFAHYRLNGFLINPAIAGSSPMVQLRLNHRAQWNKFPGSPTTTSVSLHGQVDEKSGMGMILFNDQQGPTNRIGGQAAYAFHLPLDRNNTKLAFGVAIKALQYTFNREKVYFQDPTDIAIAEASQSLWAADVAFGTYVYNELFFLGFSAPNLIQADLNFRPDTQRNIISKLYRHYFITGGYKFEYESLSVEPSILVKKVSTAPYQIEGTVKFYVADDNLIIGGSYRTDWRMSLLFGFKARNIHFSYAAEFMGKPVETASNLYGLSSEFTLGLDIGKGGKQQFYYKEKE